MTIRVGSLPESANFDPKSGRWLINVFSSGMILLRRSHYTSSSNRGCTNFNLRFLILLQKPLDDLIDIHTHLSMLSHNMPTTSTHAPSICISLTILNLLFDNRILKLFLLILLLHILLVLLRCDIQVLLTLLHLFIQFSLLPLLMFYLLKFIFNFLSKLWRPLSLLP